MRLVVEDLTERKQAEEERARLEGRIQKAKELERIGVLAGGVAHSFNNILTTIICNANIAGSAQEHGKAVTPYLETIEKSSIRATSLVNNLLAYAGKVGCQRQEMDIDLVVKEAIQFFSACLPGHTVPQSLTNSSGPSWLREAILALAKPKVKKKGKVSCNPPNLMACLTILIEFKLEHLPSAGTPGGSHG